MSTTPVQIIGGGLAGLTLGIALRRRNIPATVIEAGHYPRHKVCGEFISGAGLEVLKKLQLTQPLMERGAVVSRKAALFRGANEGPAFELPQPALSVSRWTLDALLAEVFVELNGELITERRWRQDFRQPGVVQAAGRIPAPKHNAKRHWIGIKAHADNVDLKSDLEMHFDRDRYIGLNRIEGRRVNVCGLFWTNGSALNLSRNPLEDLRGRKGSRLYERLTKAQFDPESLKTVAGLNWEPFCEKDSGVFRIGDAMTMIPPVTGNGMSIALESATAAAEVLEGFAMNQLTWPDALMEIQHAARRRFTRRLRWAGLLHRGLHRPTLSAILFRMPASQPAIARFFFQATR